jgi:hypothetical protein
LEIWIKWDILTTNNYFTAASRIHAACSEWICYHIKHCVSEITGPRTWVPNGIRNKWSRPMRYGKQQRMCLCNMVKVKVQVKLKLSLCFNRAPRNEDILEEWRYSLTQSLTSVLDGREWSASHPGRFTPRERAPGTHWIGGWVGPRAVCTRKSLRNIFYTPVKTSFSKYAPCLDRMLCNDAISSAEIISLRVIWENDNAKWIRNAITLWFKINVHWSVNLLIQQQDTFTENIIKRITKV